MRSRSRALWPPRAVRSRRLYLPVLLQLMAQPRGRVMFPAERNDRE